MDQVLIERAQAGDHAAFADLVRPHLPVARRVAASICGEADFDDVVQVSLLKAFEALRNFDSHREFRPWFLTIVRNEALNTYRSRGRRKAAEKRLISNRVPEYSPAAEDSVLEAADREVLIAAVERLSPIDRVTLETRFLAQRSEAETAAELGVPIGTVKSRSNRALKHLRLVLAALAIVIAVLVIPPVRKAVADWLGLRGVRIEKPSPPLVNTTTTTVQSLPVAASSTSPNGDTIPPGFGRSTTLTTARQLVPFAFSVPHVASLGDPSDVSVDTSVADGLVTLWWRETAHGPIPTNPANPLWALAFSAFRGSVNDQAFVKILPEGTTVVAANVNGDSGYWISGFPHDLNITARDGTYGSMTSRLAGNTLLWQHGDVTYRIEANIDQAAALALALTVR